MKFLKAVPFAHQMIEQILSSKDIAIDATAGNGHDTLFLSKLTAGTGHVYSMDIQQSALLSTKNRLETNDIPQSCYTLLHGCHSELFSSLSDSLIGNVQAIMFNFGYLPGGDHSLITKSQTSLQAVSKAIPFLAIGGRLTLTFYTGHTGGEDEYRCVMDYIESLDPKNYVVLIYKFVNLQNKPPFVAVVERVNR